MSKASLEGVNAAKRLRVREGSFGSKRVLPGFPVTNVETRRAKRGSASARKKTGSPRPFQSLAMTGVGVGPTERRLRFLVWAGMLFSEQKRRERI